MSSASHSERLTLGPNLRRARLGRDVPLESISSVTNVPVALWEGFEGDRRRSTAIRQLASTLDQPTVWTDDWLAERRADCRAALAQQLQERPRARGRSMGRWTVKRAAASSFWLPSEKA